MTVLHLTAQDYKVSQWSGGTTTEIFIWPQGANYAPREFSLRISSATVELEESDFTPLHGVMRYIVPLQGSFTLTHPDGEPVMMMPLDTPYRFSGQIPTHCVGKATDFNLMLKGVDGIMEICTEQASILPGINCLYAPHGSEVTLSDQHYLLAAGDSLLIQGEDTGVATISAGPIIRCHSTL